MVFINTVDNLAGLSVSPVNVLSQRPAFHSLIVLSADPDSIRPCSGRMITAHTAAVWPCGLNRTTWIIINLVHGCELQHCLSLIQMKYTTKWTAGHCCLPVRSSCTSHWARLLRWCPMSHSVVCQTSQRREYKLKRGIWHWCCSIKTEKQECDIFLG